MRRWSLLIALVAVVIPAAAFYWDRVTGTQVAQIVEASPPAARLGVAPESSGQTQVAVAGKAPPSARTSDVVAPPKSDWAKAPALQAAVEKSMADFPGRYAVVVHELKTGKQWTLNESDRFHPASTIKMPVTLYALDQFRAGKLGWQDLITYTEADFESPGGGAFETSPFGGRYPVENLVTRALRYSNNVAVNMLGRHLGWENIRKWSQTIGGELYREEDASPSVTAMSELGWWLHLERLSRLDPKSADLVLQPLRQVAYDGRITAGLPEGVQHVHKFGSYAGYYHDGGWIMTENPFLLVVLTHGAPEDEADAAIARVAGEIYEVMQ